MTVKIYVGYERKIQPKTKVYEYETEQFSVSISEDLEPREGPDGPESISVEEIQERAETLAMRAKEQVLAVLGIPYTISESGEIVEEARAVQQVAQATGATVSSAPATPAVIAQPQDTVKNESTHSYFPEKRR